MKWLTDTFREFAGQDLLEVNPELLVISPECEPTLTVSANDFLDWSLGEKVEALVAGSEIFFTQSATSSQIYDGLRQINQASWLLVALMVSGTIQNSYTPTWVIIPDTDAGREVIAAYRDKLDLVEAAWIVSEAIEDLSDIKDTVLRMIHILCFSGLQLVPENSGVDEDGFVSECLYGPWVTYYDDTTLSDGCSIMSSARPLEDLLEEVSRGIFVFEDMVSLEFKLKIKDLLSSNGCWGEQSTTWLKR